MNRIVPLTATSKPPPCPTDRTNLSRLGNQIHGALSDERRYRISLLRDSTSTRLAYRFGRPWVPCRRAIPYTLALCIIYVALFIRSNGKLGTFASTTHATRPHSACLFSIIYGLFSFTLLINHNTGPIFSPKKKQK